MKFTNFNARLQKHFSEITADADRLYEVELDKDGLWNLYLDSFPANTNNIFRKRREHDCSCCRQFIKNVGNVVVIKNNVVHTIWEFDAESTTYQPVIDALDTYVKSKAVSDVYVTKESHIGTVSNVEMLDTGETIRWSHFNLAMPNKFVSRGSESVAEIKGAKRDVRNVFKRSLDGISMEAIDTVLELISSNTLYRGEEWREALTSFKRYKKAYMPLSKRQRELYAWEHSGEAGVAVGKIRNHSIGTLLVNISEGMELDEAVRKYEIIVAPSNYKRPKAIFTKKMLEDAQKTVTELGYMESLNRRYATLDDITVNNILFSNKDAQKRVKGAQNVFEDMMGEVKAKPKKFDRVEEISIDKFVSDVLPTATALEAYVENRHESNFVSLIAPQNPDSKTMFKWNNGFSWAYNGNLADSEIKQNVKNAGGKVDGVLRFSIQWNECGQDNCDVDAHCVEPNGYHIYYGSRARGRGNYSPARGNLDVDIIYPDGKVAVENIVYDDMSRMQDGVYKFYVHQFSGYANQGFRAEIEFDGQIYKFDYDRPTHCNQDIDVAVVTLKNGVFTIHPAMESNAVFNTKTIWNVQTNNFVPVTVMMYSPNYWDGQNGIGNRHYMFMLKDCINDETPNGFYNEYLKPELEKHKRVFEALGGKMSVEQTDDQLSGLGFSSTKRNELVVKVIGATERIMKIKF